MKRWQIYKQSYRCSNWTLIRQNLFEFENLWKFEIFLTSKYVLLCKKALPKNILKKDIFKFTQAPGRYIKGTWQNRQTKRRIFILFVFSLQIRIKRAVDLRWCWCSCSLGFWCILLVQLSRSFLLLKPPNHQAYVSTLRYLISVCCRAEHFLLA